MTNHIVPCEYVHVNADDLPPDNFRAAAALLRALGNQHRVAIVSALAREPHCVHELVDALGIDQPLVSQHLKVLRSARLLVTERRGKEIVYSLADAHVAHIVGDAVTHAQEPT